MPEKKRLHWEGLTCEYLETSREAVTEGMHRFGTSNHSRQSSQSDRISILQYTDENVPASHSVVSVPH
jgi:hypothetical protein